MEYYVMLNENDDVIASLCNFLSPAFQHRVAQSHTVTASVFLFEEVRARLNKYVCIEVKRSRLDDVVVFHRHTLSCASS